MTTSIEQTSPYQVSDISVIIPLYVDHEDRLTNLNILKSYLKDAGIRDIIINEHFRDTPKGGGEHHTSTLIGLNPYSKMKCVNEAFECCRGRIIAIWDVDVIFPKSSIQKSITLFNTGSDMVYPYNGQFYNVPKSEFGGLMQGMIDLNKCDLWNPNSYGGCVMFKREVFEAGGKGNEKFIEWGFEDDELLARFSKLEYKIDRVDFPLFHMEHERTTNADGRSPHYSSNNRLYNSIIEMSKQELIQEINTWK
jgi:hypothetical protein